MNLKNITIFIILISFYSCTSEKEKTIQEFVGHVHNLNIDELKTICTEDTKFMIKVGIEPIFSLGDEKSKKQLEQIASTLECFGEDGKTKCTYVDENGNRHFFEMEFIEGYDENGEEKLLVDIDKKYFFGE